MRVASKICFYFARSGAASHLKDIQNECRMALWESCRKYNWRRNDNFWLYAFTRVRGAAYDYLRQQRIIVKSGKSDYTALCFLSGEGKISSDGFLAPDDCAPLFEDISGVFALEAMPTAIDARIDLVRLIDRAGLDEDEREVLMSYWPDEMAPESNRRGKSSPPAPPAALERALNKIRTFLGDEDTDGISWLFSYSIAPITQATEDIDAASCLGETDRCHTGDAGSSHRQPA